MKQLAFSPLDIDVILQALSEKRAHIDDLAMRIAILKQPTPEPTENRLTAVQPPEEERNGIRQG